MTSFSNPYFEYLINETDNVDEVVSSKIRENVTDLYKTDFILKLNSEYSNTENDVDIRFKELKQIIFAMYFAASVVPTWCPILQSHLIQRYDRKNEDT